MPLLDEKEADSLSTANARVSDGETIQLSQFTPPSWVRFAPGPLPDQRAKSLSPSAMRYGVTMCGCCVMMLSGYNHALMGSVSSSSSYLKIVGLNDGTSQSQLLIGTINALYYIGVVIGSLVVASFSDLVGRRKAIVSTAFIALATLAFFATLQNFAWALIGRSCLGLAIGAFDTVGLNWTAETAKSRRRGLSIGLTMSCAAFGACQAFFIAYGLAKSHPSEFVWRFTIAFQTIFILTIATASCILPESPRWLVRAGNYGEAHKVLSALSGDDGLEQDEHIASISGQIALMQQALIEERQNNASSSYLSMLFVQDRYRTARRTWTALFIQFSCQFCIGAGLVATYGIQLFSSGGWSAQTATLLAGFGILTQVLFGLPGAMLSDRIGRRPALIGGAFCGSVILCFIGMCGYFVTEHKSNDLAKAKQFGVGTVALVLLWSAQFGMTWLGASFTYPTEIFIAQSRAKGNAFGVVGFGLGSFTCNMISPYLFAAIGHNALFLFGGLSFMVGIVCFFFMPETANKSLEDIDSLFH